jgi:hypothetical protein
MPLVPRNDTGQSAHLQQTTGANPEINFSIYWHKLPMNGYNWRHRDDAAGLVS